MLEFSVITICRNDAVGLAATLRSIGNQSYPYTQCIVQDCGSRDFSLQIARGYRDWVDIINSSVTVNVAAAMKEAITLATGEFAIFLNSGDVFSHGTVLDRVAETMVDSDEVVQELSSRNSAECSRFDFPANDGEKFVRRNANRQALIVKNELLRRPEFDWDVFFSNDERLLPLEKIAGYSVRESAFEMLQRNGARRPAIRNTAQPERLVAESS